MLTEQWMPIAGYEGRYEVSSFGRVKSLPRYRRGKSGGRVPIPEKIMATPLKKAGLRTRPYAEVKLRDGAPRDLPCKTFLVHRLVAQAFIGDLGAGKQVDHIDGHHSNNHVANLRILSAVAHGRIHPCVVDAERNAQMQARAQAAIAELRATGQLIGRHRVPVAHAATKNVNS